MTATPQLSSSALIDQNSVLFKQLPLILLINVPLIAALAWLYWPWVDHSWLIAWCSSMVVIMLLRFLLYGFIYRRIPQENLEQWHMKVFAGNSAISGFMWGMAGVLFFVPEQLEYQLIIFLVLILKGAGSVTAVTSYLPSFYAYFPLSMIPISLTFLLQGDITHMLLGLMGVLFTVALLAFGTHLNRTLVESLQLRYENQRLLEQTQHQKQQAEQANHAKSRFLAAASHDLRQPIHALSLFNTVLEQSVTDEKTSEVVAQTRSTIDTLQNLLDALMDVSKLDAGTVEVHKRHFNLQNIISRLANDFEPQAKENGISLLWPEEGYAVYSDEDLLEQVLRNLVSNAIRYTSDGGVEVRTVEHENFVRIEVIDTGVGIEQDQQANIFNEFYQVGNVQRDRRQGLGLGLAIVDRVIRLLGSSIHLESEPGKGSRFLFDIDKGDNRIAQEAKLNFLGVAAPDTIECSVAVVEDDVEVGIAMQTLLESWGCKVMLSADCEGIIREINASGPPDIIISDYQLANGSNGIQAIRKIQQHIGENIPALIVTGNIAAESLQEVRKASIPVLHKPAAPAKLRAFLRNMTKHNR